MHAPIWLGIATPSAYLLSSSLSFACFFIISTFGIGLTLDGPTKLVSRPNVARVCVEVGLLKENLPNRVLIGSTLFYIIWITSNQLFLFEYLSSVRIADDLVMPVTNAKRRIRNLVSTRHREWPMFQEPMLPIRSAPTIETMPAADMQTIEDGPRGEELEPDNNPFRSSPYGRVATLLFFKNRSI